MKTCIMALALCLCAVPAFAQVPSNPSTVVFDPSPNHADPPGSIREVTRYILEIATVAAPTVVVKTADLGKPAIVAGQVTAAADAVVSKLPVGNYVAVVKAEGPGGVSTGAVSDPFPLKALPPAAPGRPVWK